MFTRRATNYLYNYGAYVVSFINYVRRIAAYIRSEKNAPVVRRSICWIICLGLLVSNTPASTAMIGWRPSKSRARLTHQPPERILPDFDKSRRLTPAIPKMLSQVPVWNKPVKKNNRVVDLLTNAMSYAWPGSFLAFGMSSPSDLSSDADKVRGETRNTFTSTPSSNKSAATPTESVGRSRSADTAAPMFQSGDDNWPMAMLAPINRVSEVGGVDLLSRNYNWTLPLVDLPGRAELDLSLTLSLNSLIWTKSGGNIHFNKAGGFPSPGFHLGFPELKTYFYNSEAGVGSRLVIMPSGKSFEFWENPALGNGIDYIYEERNGSNMIIVETPGLFDQNETVWVLLTPDGTAYKYVVVGSNPKCVEIKDRNGNYISVAYNTSTEKISRITDTLEREVNFNYGSNNRLTSITQNWGGVTHTWATFAYSTVTISAGFLSLNMVGAQNGQAIPVLSRVELADGSVHSFEYNTYGQVHTIRRYAPNTATPGGFPGDYTQLSYVTYDLPRDGSGQQNDCPRFITRKDWAHDWNNNNEVTTRFAGDLSSWGSVTDSGKRSGGQYCRLQASRICLWTLYVSAATFLAIVY